MTMQNGPCRPGFLWAAGLTFTALCLQATAQQDATTAEKPATPDGNVAVMGAIRVSEELVDTTSYTAPALTTGKTPLSIRETPQSVTVITRQRMDDQNMTTLPEVLKQATGVTVQRFDGAGNFNSYNVRGYAIDSIMLDGLSSGITGNVVEFDTAIYDRVEILRGPAGLFQGSGEPSAVINLARKRALTEPLLNLSARLGSWDTYRGEFDASGSLAQDGRLRGRLVGAYDQRESYQDVIENNKHIVYGTLEYDLTPSTTASVGATWQEIDSVIDQGLPAYANGQLLDVPRSTFIGADWNEQDLESSDVFAEIEHHLDGGGDIKFAVRKLDRDMLYKVARGNAAVAPNGDVLLQTGLFTTERENVSADVYASLPFSLGGQEHNFVAGFDWRTQEENSNSSPFVNSTLINVFEPNHDIAEPNFSFTSLTKTKTDQYGAYTQLRLHPAKRVTVVGGGRLSWYDSKTTNRLTEVTTGSAEESGELTPYAAVVVDVLPQASVYASYTNVFQPQNNLDAQGGQLPPRTGSQIEAGIKAELFDQQANAQFAVYQIRDRDRAMTDDSPGAPLNSFVAAGEVESKGFDTEISGRLAPGWDVVLGYAFTETEYVHSAATQLGQVFAPFTPKHTGNLWTKYQFGAGPLQAFHVGTGVKSLSSFYSPVGATRFEAGGYTVVSALAGYQVTPQLETTLTVNNLFDKKYYEKVSSAGRQNFYGEPLNVMLVLRAHF